MEHTKSKCDHVKQVALNYFQRVNYTNISNHEITANKFVQANVIDSKVSVCWNNDSHLDFHIIDSSFSKFLHWLKELAKNKEDTRDLEALIGPLFCHFYWEILRADRAEQATNFFKMHVSSIDKTKCDETVKDLINAISNNSLSLSTLKETFRSNKYAVKLSEKSIQSLKKFIAEECDMVFLEVLQFWFEVIETEEEKNQEEAEEVKDTEMLCTGVSYANARDLKNAIMALKSQTQPLYIANISNIKNDVTCGLLNRQNNIAVYCHTNSIFVQSLGVLRDLDYDDSQEIALRGHTSQIYDVNIIKNRPLLVSASGDTTVRILDLQTQELKHVCKGHDNPVYRVKSSLNGAYIASGSSDGTVRMWPVETGNTVRVLAGHKQEVTGVDFHPNSIYLATCAVDSYIRMWNITDATPVRLFCGSKGPVYAVAFSPAGRFLASAGNDERVRIWDLVACKQVVEMRAGPEPVTCLTWSSNEDFLVSGSTDASVRTWNFKNIMKCPSETEVHEPMSCSTLNPKLLSIEYCNETFGCLCVDSKKSTLLS